VGNVSASSEERRVRVDSQAPTAPTVDLDAASDSGFSDTDDLTRVVRPIFNGKAEPNSTVRLYKGQRLLGTGTATEYGDYSFAVDEALSEGENRITATATDAAGNTSDVSEALNVVVDRQAPDTFIDSSLKNLTNETMAAFGFSSDEQNISFVCSLDGGPFEPCEAPKWYDRLSDGQHVFEVWATDAAGNTDPSPARRGWTVDATAPTVTNNVTPIGRKVPPKTTVAATFSEPMNEVSLEALGTFTLKKGTTTIAATVDYDPTTQRATLSPTKKLRSGATYTATITIGAKDLAGNALAANKVWQFRVR
jgi:Bacterial Ig-like domain